MFRFRPSLQILETRETPSTTPLDPFGGSPPPPQPDPTVPGNTQPPPPAPAPPAPPPPTNPY